MTPHLWHKVKGIKVPLNEGERGKWKGWLKTQHSKKEDHGIQSHHVMAKRRGKSANSDRYFIFLGSKITADSNCRHEIKDTCSLKENYDKPRQHIKNQRHHFVNKGPCNQSYVFSSSQVHMWGLDHKEGWMLKNWCFWIVLLGKTLWESLGLQGDQTNQS